MKKKMLVCHLFIFYICFIFGFSLRHMSSCFNYIADFPRLATDTTGPFIVILTQILSANERKPLLPVSCLTRPRIDSVTSRIRCGGSTTTSTTRQVNIELVVLQK